jgi:outer membrane protein OmpA-like peptidoglycan-associated protein
VDAHLFIQLQQQSSFTTHALKKQICLLLLLNPWVLGSLLFGQDIAIHPLGIDLGTEQFGMSLHHQQLLITTRENEVKWINHKDKTGSGGTRIQLIEDTTKKISQAFAVIPHQNLNESNVQYSAELNIYQYTRSIQPNLHSRKNSSLGIFFFDPHIASTSAFPFNSLDLTYQVGQGYYCDKTNRLYFVSDMPGGFGGNDLYYSEWNNGVWQEPIALPHPINDEKDAVYPTILPNGDLIYSSNDGALGDFDLHRCPWNGAQFQAPVHLETPLNSAFDDLQILYTEDQTQGYLISNRDDGLDRLFSFHQTRPRFIECELSEKPILCYLFEETTIAVTDSLPMVFEWAFSDGTKANGLKTEHCFPGLGHYHAILNVYDSTTKVLYANLSELELDIEKSQRPLIASPTEIQPQQVSIFIAEDTEIDSMQIERIDWHFGDGQYAMGKQVYHTYQKEGTYACQLMFTGINSNGEKTQTCASKDIVVGLSKAPLVMTTTYTQTTTEAAVPIAKDSLTYYVEFKKSENQMAANDPYFANIHYAITERQVISDSLFHYTIGAEKDFKTMMPILEDIKKSGYTESVIKDNLMHQDKRDQRTTWWYIPDSIESALNKQMNRFNDIKFESGSYTISKQSFDELQYIAEVLRSQPKIHLQITAHTDSVGTVEHNLELSKKRADSVAKHLSERGIPQERLTTIGLGESESSMLIHKNKSQAAFRKVEFRIIRNR